MDQPAAPAPGGATPSPATSYDAVPYSVGAFPQTSPDRLATLATLFGMTPTPPDACRVLELGCALGGNLIPMALANPTGRFVGIDLSPVQVAEGQRMIDAMGLTNVELHAMSILDVTDALGTFDYILTHGVYSWVPPQVQEKILDVSRHNLNPQGVAYVSYNALPGWHARAAVREMLWYHTASLAEPADRVRAARGLLAFMTKSLPDQLAGYGALVRQELEVLTRTPDSYLLHEHLEEYNEPLYFHQFADRAARGGLQYLGEAQVSTMFAGRFGPEVERTLRQISADLLHMEQYMDFMRNRMFRQTLLCHAGVKLNHALRPEAVQALYVASPAKPVSPACDARSSAPEQFRAPGTPTLTTHEPLMKAAMLELADRWPMSVPFLDLLAAARQRAGLAPPADAGRAEVQASELSARILNCYTSALVELSVAPPPFVTHVSDRPVASPFARLRAATDARVVNMRLEAAALAERPRELLRLLDGQHDRAALLDVIRGWGPGAIADSHTPEEALDSVLDAFAKMALLIA